MRRLFLFFIISFHSITAITQSNPERSDFIAPLDIPMYLSGNFAELRSDHFHSGIDIKTNGVNGERIYSINDGYISRIKIQANGYGKSIYINHPGGYTSLYGHLSNYNDIIDQYVKKYQYFNQTHTLDIYPGKNELTVSKGELIGFTGNTGSSSGPHLHFEIRNAANQHPLNVLKFYHNIKDNIPPRIYTFYTYLFEGVNNNRVVTERNSFIPMFADGNYYIRKKIYASAPISFGIESYDYLNGSSNRCGIYSIKVKVNKELFYHFQTDQFSFYESRYINAHTDYQLRKTNKKRVHYLFRKPNNKLSLYKYLKNGGILEPEPGKTYNIEVLLKDVEGNSSKLNLIIEGTEAITNNKEQEEDNENLFRWYENNNFSNQFVKLDIPSGTLYENMVFNYYREDRANRIYPYILNLGDNTVPLHKYVNLSLNLEKIPARHHRKAFIARLEDEEISGEGGIVSKGWIHTKVREFGKYTVEIDTIAPTIKPLNIFPGKNMSGVNDVRFIIQDALSGIENYRGYINNEWVLFEYDPKNNLLTHHFEIRNSDPEPETHELKLFITDERGNQSIYQTTFRR